MGAIYNEYGLSDTIRMAIDAGNDLAMICHRIDAIGEARDALTRFPSGHLDRALASIAKFKERMAPPHDFSEAAFRKLDAAILQHRVDVLGEERAAERSPEDGKRSPVESY